MINESTCPTCPSLRQIWDAERARADHRIISGEASFPIGSFKFNYSTLWLLTEQLCINPMFLLKRGTQGHYTTPDNRGEFIGSRLNLH
jgi:hypothetical protein